MSNAFSVKTWIMISSYLDGKLPPDEVIKVKSQLEQDPAFKQAVDEISYTRRMLRSLPQKRAPRNFTLSPSKVKPPIRYPWAQPALSFLSMAAAAAMVVIFAGSYLFSGSRSAIPESVDTSLAIETASQELDSQQAPPLITWNQAWGMGGGGGAPDSGEVYKGGVGGGVEQPAPLAETAEPEIELPALAATQPAETEPTQNEFGEQTADTAGDLSTLILGLPEPEEAGEFVDSRSVNGTADKTPVSTRLLLLIISGGIALISGAAALFLRRR